MTLNLFGSRPRNDPERVAEIKQWVAEVFRLRPETSVLVTELRCTEPGCPPVETVVTILDTPGQPRHHKLPTALAEVTFADVRRLASAVQKTYLGPDLEQE